MWRRFFAIIKVYFSDDGITASCLGTSLIRHLLMVQHFSETCVYFNIPLWSIVTETFVYLLFPFLALILRWYWAAALMSVALYVSIFFSQSDIDLVEGGMSLVRTLAGFAAGGAIAMLHRALPDQMLAGIQVPALIGLIAAVMWRIEIAAVITMILLVLATARNVGVMSHVARWPALYVFGRASFSLYLSHIPVMSILVLIAAKIEVSTGLPIFSNWYAFVPVCLIVCGGIGVLSYLMVEHRIETKSRSYRSEPV